MHFNWTNYAEQGREFIKQCQSLATRGPTVQMNVLHYKKWENLFDQNMKQLH